MAVKITKISSDIFDHSEILHPSYQLVIWNQQAETNS